MDVVSFTPSLMMSITIAMSIDYSLFLLSRFMEELAAGKTVDEVTATALPALPGFAAWCAAPHSVGS